MYVCCAARVYCRSDEGFLCGNGILDNNKENERSPEQCDDGNREPGDGCNSDCRVEEGYECSISTSQGHQITSCTDRDECDPKFKLCNAGANFACTNTIGSYTCTCKPGYMEQSGSCVKCTGDDDGCSEGKSCHDIKLRLPQSRSGVYTISPASTAKPLSVYCDMERVSDNFLNHLST